VTGISELVHVENTTAANLAASDLMAMLECQAYALEDVMKQKKNLQASSKAANNQLSRNLVTR